MLEGYRFQEDRNQAVAAGAKIIVRKGERLDKADVLADYRGLELVKRSTKGATKDWK